MAEDPGRGVQPDHLPGVVACSPQQGLDSSFASSGSGTGRDLKQSSPRSPAQLSSPGSQGACSSRARPPVSPASNSVRKQRHRAATSSSLNTSSSKPFASEDEEGVASGGEDDEDSDAREARLAFGDGRRAQRKFLELDVLGVRIKKLKSTTARLHTSVIVTGSNRFPGTYRTLLRVHFAARHIVAHRAFTWGVAWLIVLNAAFVGWETDLEDEDWTLLRLLSNQLFTIIFTVELLVRSFACKTLGEFSEDRGNIFDLVLVVVSCLDSFVLTPILQGQAQGNHLVLLRVVRVARLARLVRTIRLIRLFQDLWLLVAGIFEAMWTLMWTWVLLFMLVYIFGIFTTRTIGQQSSEVDDPEIYGYFGTLPLAMFTLFQVTTTEGWAVVARLCMDRQPWTVVLFLLYLYITTFAVMNVVVAVIVENTLDQAGAQRQKHLAKQQELMLDSCVKIYQVFRKADADDDGIITQEEFHREIQNEDVRQGLQQLGIDIRQAENLFGILDYDESGGLDAEEFVGGMMKAVGLARAKDVLAVECDSRRSNKSLHEHLGRVVDQANKRIDEVEKGVKELRSQVGTVLEALDKKLSSGAKKNAAAATAAAV